MPLLLRLGLGRQRPDDVLGRGLADVDLLADWYEEWLTPSREHLHQLRLHALEALCRRLVSLGRHAEAVGVALEAVQADPLRESANRVLVEAHLAEGNVSEAMVQRDRYVDVLRSEIGIDPSPHFTALVLAAPSRR
jgi:DNA-binding SARP family transcriptional activator